MMLTTHESRRLAAYVDGQLGAAPPGDPEPTALALRRLYRDLHASAALRRGDTSLGRGRGRALVASRQPRNPIGWIFCGLTLFVAITAPAEAYEERYYAGVGGSQAAAELAAWFSNWTWVPAVLVPLVYVPLFFPDGRLLSPRWRVVAWVGGIGIAGFAFSEAFAAGKLYGRDIENPYGIDHVLVDLAGFGSILVLGAIVASVVSVVLRFRRATGMARQQIKWLAYAACLALALFVPAALMMLATSFAEIGTRGLSLRSCRA